ncbi:uncharacterized protein [Aegilops tauschii subsp. strangulata]|uniref:uncharacterized protein n=1 Tax=Aegilops tauschii subsp. strangulata TaxID=200361 RepID=UPI003CC86DD4
MEKLKWRLQMKGFAGVSSDGLSGGLALYWDENLQVTVLDSCARYIDVRIVDGANDKTWRTTFVYGEPRVEHRHRMWSALSNLRAVSSDPWLVCGDFNEAMWQHEHFSRSQCPENQMLLFRDCLETCKLMDLGFSGAPFTYDNGQMGERNVRVRLDRACADEALRDLFPFAQVTRLATSCSDHAPLMIRLAHEEPMRTKISPRYEIMWEGHPGLGDVIAETWRKSKPRGHLGAVRDAMKEMMHKLWAWSKENFGHVITEIEKLWTELADVQLHGADRVAIRQKMYKLDELLYREEMLWL